MSVLPDNGERVVASVLKILRDFTLTGVFSPTGGVTWSRIGRGCRFFFFGVTATEFFHFVAQSVTTDVEKLRGFYLIAVGLLQSEFDESVFDVFERSATFGN